MYSRDSLVYPNPWLSCRLDNSKMVFYIDQGEVGCKGGVIGIDINKYIITWSLTVGITLILNRWNFTGYSWIISFPGKDEEVLLPVCFPTVWLYCGDQGLLEVVCSCSRVLHPRTFADFNNKYKLDERTSGFFKFCEPSNPILGFF